MDEEAVIADVLRMPSFRFADDQEAARLLVGCYAHVVCKDGFEAEGIWLEPRSGQDENGPWVTVRLGTGEGEMVFGTDTRNIADVLVVHSVTDANEVLLGVLIDRGVVALQEANGKTFLSFDAAKVDINAAVCQRVAK